MTPTAGKWRPISTHALNIASVDILSGVSIPATAKGMLITFDSATRVSQGTTQASGTFGHPVAEYTPMFFDSVSLLAGDPDFVTACAVGGTVPPQGHVTFYEVVTNIA